MCIRDRFKTTVIVFILYSTAVLSSDIVIPKPPSPIKLTTVFFGFANFTPNPHANEKPTRPKSKGENNDGGLK